MASFVFIQYGRNLKVHCGLRSALLLFTLVSFVSAGVVGFFGAMLDKFAPVEGGHTIHLRKGDTG